MAELGTPPRVRDLLHAVPEAAAFGDLIAGRELTRGGPEVFLAGVHGVAALDGSLGWLAVTFNAAAHEVGARADALIATSHQRAGRFDADGRLSGRWDAVVGAAHADRFLLTTPAGRVLVPGDVVVLEPSADALTGAGICAVTLPPWPVDGRLLAAASPAVVVVTAAGAAAAVVGAADGVWDRHVAMLRARLAATYSGEKVSDEAAAQIARSASDIDAARLQVRAVLADPDGVAVVVRACRQAVARARDAADRLFGSARHAMDASDPVSRAWRDLHAGCRLAVQLLDAIDLPR